MNAVLETAAREWLAHDPDPETRSEIEALLASGDEAALSACFGERLAFGTAGLRGRLGPGPGSMNRAMVRWVTDGLARYVKSQGGESVVIGFDGRKNSDVFAEDAARVLCAHGLEVYLYDRVCPTPELAHAVVALACGAGIMVTASHNPPQDNGYKVYWANGAQIIAPHDKGISASIDACTPGQAVMMNVDRARLDGLLHEVPPGIRAAYLDKVDRLRVHRDVAPIPVVYTAMHGVGAATVEAVLERAGQTAMTPVKEQHVPDGAFPTVSFPNPEEPGALDLAKQTADEVGADLIVANDPDADRLAVAIRTDAGWRQLTGNQVGVLLAEDLLTHGEQWKSAPRLVATTIVSSTLLSRIAKHHGVAYAETLTGFKWIANQAIAFDAEGGHFVMGYEEALGYSVGPVARDKDGVSAVLLLVDLAAWLKGQGRTLLDAVEDLYRRHGVHASGQVSTTLPGAEGKAKIASVLAGLRANPPAEIGGIAVTAATDVQQGTRTLLAEGRTEGLDLPKSNVLAWDLADGSRVLARPSGTEPKIKFYFEVVEPMKPEDTLASAEARAAGRMQGLMQDFKARSGL